MNRTIGYWLEQLFRYGPGLGIIIYLLCYPMKSGFVFNGTLLDKIIGISSTLFGFLLAILTLIVQSDSAVVLAMKSNESYGRLISFNKYTVLMAIINSLVSLVITTSFDQIKYFSDPLNTVIGILNFGLFCFVITNSILFTIVFYRILEEEARLQSNTVSRHNTKNLIRYSILACVIVLILLAWILKQKQ